ncbi:MAG: T9SS type A sorting domain-containing protein [Candidatus Latescibacteria bacterium]|nr:T9SS type A sorting domain-containing protein [Candidatus Latescibacterota bacterium]
MSKNVVKIMLAILVLLPVVLIAQNLPCRTFGGTTNEKAHALVNRWNENGGYVMAGYTENLLSASDTNILIVEIDSLANPVQAKVSIGANTEIATSLIRTSDLGYALTGWTRSYGTGTPKANIFVIKLDNTLTVQWGYVYSEMSGSWEDQAYSIIEVSAPMGGGYAVVGWTEYAGAGPSPAILVMRIDPLGILLPQWPKIYHRRTPWEPSPILSPAEGYDIVELPVGVPGFINGGFAITGRAKNPYYPTFNWDAFMMSIDTSGTPVHFKVLGSEYDDEGYSIIFDNMITVAGWTNGYGPGTGTAGAPANIFVWKMDMFGNDLWKNAYGWMNDDEKVMDEQSLMVDYDGNYALAGWTRSVGHVPPPNSNFLIMKIDQMTGMPIWTRVHPSIPGAQDEEAYPIINTMSGGYAIAGWTNSFGLGGADFHFLTLDPMGNRPVCVLDEMPMVEPIMWTEPETAVFFPEGFGTVPITLDVTTVGYTDVCEISSNDTNDVGPTGIFFTPSSPVDSTANVTPSAYLYNYGNTTVDYTAQMTVGSFYTGTYAVTNHTPQTTIQADFPSWTDWPRGLHTVKCTTQLTGDRDNTNDSLTGQLMVYVHDVGTVQINQPTGNLDSVATFTPQAKVKNFGNVSENFNVKFTIEGPSMSAWTDDTMVTVGAGNELIIDFADWTVFGAGDYTTKCSTELATDMDDLNDKQDSVFTVVGQFDYNVGTVAIYMPTAGNIDSTATITPQAKVKNYGTSTEIFNVKFTIDGPAKATWTDDTTVTLNSLDELTIDFAGWTVGPPGDYTAKCSTELSTDLFADNDKKEVAFTIVVAPPVIPGWAQKESIPHPPDIKVNKYVKDGGCLTTESGKIYAFPGNKSWQFYKYTPGALGVWSQLESIPYGPKETDPLKINKKKIGKGASICAEGDKIYAVKGNGTKEFWVYYIDAENPYPADTWIQLASVPVVKGLKAGTSILHWGRAHVHKIYLLAGGQKVGQKNFFVYDINTGVWDTLPEVTAPGNKAFKDGSCIALADKKIWALQGGGKNNYLFMYDSVPKTWHLIESVPMIHPTIDKKKKVKAGAAMTKCDDLIYLIKGGGSGEFWAFNPEDSSWTPKETIPMLQNSKKSVPKSGAALTELDDKVWLFKGNNSAEFWCYTPAPTKSDKKNEMPDMPATIVPNQGAITTQMTPLLQITPNPFTQTAVINYMVPIAGKVSLKLYNVTGSLVKTLTNEYHNPGAYTFNLSNVASGIYFLKYESSKDKSEVKLIVQ